MKITRPYALLLFEFVGICLGGRKQIYKKNAQSHSNACNLLVPHTVPMKIRLILVEITEE